MLPRPGRPAEARGSADCLVVIEHLLRGQVSRGGSEMMPSAPLQRHVSPTSGSGQIADCTRIDGGFSSFRLRRWPSMPCSRSCSVRASHSLNIWGHTNPCTPPRSTNRDSSTRAIPSSFPLAVKGVCAMGKIPRKGFGPAPGRTEIRRQRETQAFPPQTVQKSRRPRIARRCSTGILFRFEYTPTESGRYLRYAVAN